MAFFARERRSRPRVRTDSEVVVLRGEDRIACRTKDVSSVGMSLICPAQAVLGTLLHLQIFLNSGVDWLAVDGILVREERYDNGFLLDIRFHLPEPRVSATLVAHVRDSLRQLNQVSLPVERGRLPAPGMRNPQARRSAPDSRVIKNLYLAALRSLR